MTISEMLDKLSQFPQDWEVVIDDADTGWLLRITEIEKRDDRVVIGGNYQGCIKRGTPGKYAPPA